jgi:hypothetical protein
MEPRTVIRFSTISKIGSGKSPGGKPTSDMKPLRRNIPTAWLKALLETAVTSTP